MSAFQWGETKAHQSNPESSKSQLTDKYGERRPQKGGAVKIAFEILKWSLYIVAGFIIWLNVQPYIGMLTALFSGYGQSPLIAFFFRIFGFILNPIRSIFLSIAGIILWAIFQTMELMPMILESDTALQRRISGLLSHRRKEVNQSDSNEVRKLKVKYNRKPITWIRRAKIGATMAYLIDFTACFLYYPPIKGGIENIGTFMIAPSASDIDWKNLVLMAVTLFSVEAIAQVLIWLHEGRLYFGLGKSDKA